MTFNVTGTIVKVLDKKSGTSQAGKEWASQDFVLQEKGSENVLFFNVFGEENITSYNLEVGDEVSVILEVRSREWNGKYFTELRGRQCFHTTKKPATSVQTPPIATVGDAPF